LQILGVPILANDECHIRHCLLYEFHRNANATDAAKNKAMSVSQCQRWLKNLDQMILPYKISQGQVPKKC